MDSIEPPSFSLGFEHEIDDDVPQPGFCQNPTDQLIGDKVEPEPELTVSDSDLESELGCSSPVLKRLRRGTVISKCSPKENTNELFGSKEDRDVDDDIEEFSSPEDAPASTKSHISSCSSVVPLQLHCSEVKRKWLDVPPSTSTAGSGVISFASLFQRSTRSPLRRFQLLDSDSDDEHPSTIKNAPPSVASIPKRRESQSKNSKIQTPARVMYQLLDSDSEDDIPSSSVVAKPKRKESGSMPFIRDLWKDFSPVGISNIQTPTLDDICQDYFSTAKKQSTTVASSSNQQNGQFSDLSHPSPPSHCFFLHSDPRIQNLARRRLPNFFPLGICNNRDKEREVCLVDYMNQFCSKGSSKTGESRSKTRSAAPKDASKRRVSAKSGSAGHWFTSPEGKKVYISKSGQEFSGQTAYKCYKKENGGGFSKSRKKRQPKKKAKN